MTQSPPSSKPADIEAGPATTRARILDAAEHLFADRGFAGAAMRDIAASVELNPASLYNHFPGKQALYEAVLERGLRPMFELLEGLGRSEWTAEQFDRSTDALLDHLARRPHLPRLILQEALAGGEHLTRLARDWLRPLYSRALATFQESGVLEEWEEAELPLLLMALHHLILGHFATAPMLREVLDEDPLSQEAIDRHGRFVRRIVRLLLLEGTSLRREE
jgi:AcrR family transcriptional regulator